LIYGDEREFIEKIGKRCSDKPLDSYGVSIDQLAIVRFLGRSHTLLGIFFSLSLSYGRGYVCQQGGS